MLLSLKVQLGLLLKKYSPQFRSFFKYGVVGVLFTLTGPALFLLLSLHLPRVMAIVISEPLLYASKYFLYKNWVYAYRRVNFPLYLCQVIPLYFVSILLIRLTQQSLTSLQAIILVVVVNGFLGYWWGCLLYKKLS